MSAAATFALLACGSFGALVGLSGAFWLALKVMRISMGPPNPVGVLVFIAWIVVLAAVSIAYLQRLP